MSEVEQCKICNEQPSKYSCPKCNIMYCSVTCYKSPNHIKCSEAFYRKWVEDELAAAAEICNRTSDDNMLIREMLTRTRDQLGDENFDIKQALAFLDSDDDGDEDEEEDEGAILAERMEGIDINDSDAVWDQLTNSERNEFEQLVDNNEIMKLVPNYKPWWLKDKSKLIVVNSKEGGPKICQNIKPFETLCTGEPPKCIHNNIWNVVTAYVCTVRFFNGEHHTSPLDAISYLVLLCANLRKNRDFNDADEAITAVEVACYEEDLPLPVGDFTDLQKDSRCIMFDSFFKACALSDVVRIAELAIEAFNKKPKMPTMKDLKDFSDRFEGKLIRKLKKPKINSVIDKVHFFLSYLNRNG